MRNRRTDRMQILIEASCLGDARREAGIGRYAEQLRDALRVSAEHDAIDLRVTAPMAVSRRLATASESRPGRFLRAQARLLGALIRCRPDLIHGVGGEPTLLFPSRRQIVTVHDVELWTSRSPGWRGIALVAYRRLIARGIRKCALAIAVSPFSAAAAVATLGLDPARVVVIPLAAGVQFQPNDDGDDARLRAGVGLTADDPYLLWVGSLRHHDPRKGLDTLLDGAAEAKAALGSTMPSLVLVGATGTESERVLSRADGLGIVASAVGRRTDEELAALYRGATAALIASTHEGFGLPMLEAMACGVPVIATAAGNLPDLGGDAVLFFPADDAAALGEAISRIIREPALAAMMRSAGTAQAQPYSWQRTAALTVSAYRRVVESARSGHGRC